MNVDDAAYATVHDYPGGSESLAPRVGMSGALLRNKVNPNNDRNALMLSDASRLMGVTGDLRILHALAAEHDCMVVPASGSASDPATLVDLIMERGEREGEFARAVREALSDGVISPRELATIHAASGDVQSVMTKVLRKLHASMAPAPVVAQ